MNGAYSGLEYRDEEALGASADGSGVAGAEGADGADGAEGAEGADGADGVGPPSGDGRASSSSPRVSASRASRVVFPSRIMSGPAFTLSWSLVAPGVWNLAAAPSAGFATRSLAPYLVLDSAPSSASATSWKLGPRDERPGTSVASRNEPRCVALSRSAALRAKRRHAAQTPRWSTFLAPATQTPTVGRSYARGSSSSSGTARRARSRPLKIPSEYMWFRFRPRGGSNPPRRSPSRARAPGGRPRRGAGRWEPSRTSPTARRGTRPRGSPPPRPQQGEPGQALGEEEALGEEALGASAAATARTRHIAAGSRRARRAQTASKPSVNETGGGDPSRSDPSAASGPAPPSTRAASAASRSTSAASRRVVRSRTETRYPASSFEASVEASTLRRASGASSGAIASRTISAVGGASSPCAKSRARAFPRGGTTPRRIGRRRGGSLARAGGGRRRGSRLVPEAAREGAGEVRGDAQRRGVRVRADVHGVSDRGGVPQHRARGGKAEGTQRPALRGGGEVRGRGRGSRSRGRNRSERTYRRASPGAPPREVARRAGAGAGAGDGVGKYAEDARASGGRRRARSRSAPGGRTAKARPRRSQRRGGTFATPSRTPRALPRRRRATVVWRRRRARSSTDSKTRFRAKETVGRGDAALNWATRAIEPSGVPDSRNRPSFQRHARDATCPRLPRRCG